MVALSWVRFIGAAILSCLFVATAISRKPASAVENLLIENQSSEVISNQTSQLSSLPDQQKVTAEETALAQKLVDSQQVEPIAIKQQPKLIAQIDSSGSVGDTFGESNELRQQLLIEPIVGSTGKRRLTAAPSSSAGTPTAYGASFGQAFIGGGAFFPLEDGDVDGSLSLGFGLGDAVKSVGLEVATNIISVGGQEENLGDFGDSGTVGFKLHKYLPDGTAVAVGWSNPVKWGEANQAKETIYGVVTKSFNLVTVSVGLGSGSFASKGARQANENAVNVFGSLGLRVAPAASLVSSWTGNSLNLGASFVPLKNTPIVVNTIFTDVTDNLNNGVGFSLSAGYIFQF
ncbi:hypothetical protein H6G54_05440 [Anabaena cylindrica FACHB-243]|uniref:Uncharacterized protein n=2 Tax=Anabaena TaxID=1163 RepID=K9ZKJ9_ANACC|nr:hypothetical protein [Anabaena cylindrica]AFZ59758.1 hypothetical protein Anacy_4398 [Anabaena cylindrica PCC 7122]MBD2417163.1 hypothetical protein [Anabaena cylindrica FACHB-243]MBY5309421.1 hypothetical protein [Anabaena sp. CCAP 1446/1C]BAY03192.1 hypothetical protein NIES19_24440 [Anabaena cylindrica PCC 7122]